MRPEERVGILAVDDSPQKLLAISAILSELNENLVTATSGRDALRLLLHQEFAVILLDINMPGMDGFETAALIRQRKHSQHTPIIFITSYGDETHASRGYSLGAVDYILAPVEPEVLKTKVLVFVELFRKSAQIRYQAEVLEHRALQLQRLTQASLAINSALSLERILQVVAELARDILDAHQAVAITAVDEKWSSPKIAVALSSKYSPEGERAVLREAAALLSFVASRQAPVRLARGGDDSGWRDALGSDRPGRLGWLAAPLTGRDGRNTGLIHLLDKREGDFTEEDEVILTQLAQMSSIAIENTVNAEAREANRIKDEFLTTLSHELRTPLSAILGWTRALRSQNFDPERAAHGLEVIERNVVAQTRLIDDLLDVSRIITGKLRLQIRPAPLTPVVEAAIEAMRPAAEAKRIQIRFDNGLEGKADQIIGDPDRLQQAVWNLISNAIKFTPAGGDVEVALEQADGLFELRVTDTGRGIPSEFLPHVFERFRQADSSTTRTHGGLGIGLAIARHFAELHGGSISAESAGENRGAVFRISLPAVAFGIPSRDEVVPRSVHPRPALPRDSAELVGVKILVVEDQPDGRELVRQTFQDARAEVLAVASAPEALEALPVFQPAVLVSDIGMPGEDGYSLIERIRRLPASQGGEVPAIALSAYAREEDRIRSLGAGFQAHLTKPFEAAELVSVTAGLLRRGFADSSESCPVPPRPSGDEEPIGVSPGGGASARVLIVEDDSDAREGLRELLETWGHAVDVAEDGVRAIERAIERRPEIALIDIGLPGVDGYEVALRLRELMGREGIFLVALTGHASSEDRQRALDSGFDAHLAKPVNFSKLSSLLVVRAAP